MGIGIEDVSQICLECNRLCVNRRSLGNHVVRSHKMLGGLLGYTLKFLTLGIIPKCVCNCGDSVLWNKRLCRFNDFLNGHNKAGYTRKDHKLTPEQELKRLNSIRKTYKNNSSLAEKIGNSVSEAFKDPDKKQNLINGQCRGWQNEERKEKHSLTQKAHWAANYDERYKKVFTPEFGRKISIANMQRDINRVSNGELVFTEHLKKVFGDEDIEHSKWFNFTSKVWCADVWIRSRQVIVEYDGIFDHAKGLLDTELIYERQIVNRINDRLKNHIAITKKINLLRIHEDVIVDDINTWDDLINNCYYVVLNGIVIKHSREFQ